MILHSRTQIAGGGGGRKAKSPSMEEGKLFPGPQLEAKGKKPILPPAPQPGGWCLCVWGIWGGEREGSAMPPRPHFSRFPGSPRKLDIDLAPAPRACAECCSPTPTPRPNGLGLLNNNGYNDGRGGVTPAALTRAGSPKA